MTRLLATARLRAALAVGLAVSLSPAPIVAATGPASATETRVRARYEITLAGFEIGTATLQAGIDRASYDINMSLRMTGLAKFMTGGRGAAAARGGYAGTSVSPSAYALNTKSSDKGQVVRFALAGGAIRQISVEPPPKTKDTIPITDADKRGVTDPLSALVMPVAGTGDVLDKSSCDRTLPVFDGRQRFDVQLRYDRMETATPNPEVKDAYVGKLLVCKASYRAIAGHKPGREQVTFMENNKEMEVWLAPVTGARALMPWRISVKTPIGTAVITATSFVVGNGDKTASGKGVDL